MANVLIVVPCFNEAARLDTSRLLREIDGVDAGFVLVDDGSTDGTLDVLRRLESQDPDRFQVLANEGNLGKAESVRRGVLACLRRQPGYVGYWDADLSTPLEEIPRFMEAFAESDAVQMVMGARVKLLGREIRRSEARHYVGRIFATIASMTLRLGVYDTQCGAKLFRANPLSAELFEQPFLSRWIFDVEILARLVEHHRRTGDCDPERAVYELPLLTWRDVPGSKVGLTTAFEAAWDLARIYWQYRR